MGWGNKSLFAGWGHRIKMAATPIYGKNPSKIFFSRTKGPCGLVYSIGDLGPFISLQFSTWKYFITLSQELWGLEDWDWVHTWTVGRCIVFTGIRLQLIIICPFISSLFCLSNFQTLKFFVTLSSGTVRPRSLKLGTHVDSGQMYCVYWNQAAAAYSSLY